MAEKRTRKITIIGLGLIGGSIGMALKRAGLENAQIVGHDRSHGVERQAEKLGSIDRGEHNLPRAVGGASLVILAVPILETREVMQQIAGDLSAGATVTDTASTKSEVMAWAKETLPATVNFVGGHPMAGKETAGIENAEASLFEGKVYCIVPALDAEPGAIKTVTGMAQLIGAEPMFMDADEHDQYAAAVSHMPLVLATALFTLHRASPSWTDLGAMASSGFRDMTRLASGDAAMAHGIVRTNRDALIHWIERMMAELARYRDMLQDARDEDLLQTFLEAQIERDSFIREPPRREPADTAQIDRKRAFMEMFIGGMMADNLRRIEKLPEVMAEQARENRRVEAAKRKPTLADRIAEGVRRDLEKLEDKRSGGEPEKPPEE